MSLVLDSASFGTYVGAGWLSRLCGRGAADVQRRAFYEVDRDAVPHSIVHTYGRGTGLLPPPARAV